MGKVATNFETHMGPLSTPLFDRRAAHRSDTCDCPFCAASLTSSTSPFDQILAEGPSVHLVPALGMLVPGYLLVTTKDHRLSMADLGSQGLVELGAWIDGITAALSATFGQYLIFEHGSCAGESSGACVDHAHIHLIPASASFATKILALAPWNELPSFSALASFSQESYAYFSFAGHHYAMARPRLGSQWIRRQIASHIGTDLWDWAIDPGTAALRKTLSEIPPLRSS